MISFAIHKRFGESSGSFELNVEHRIEKGSIISLYGPSGAGKTTLLRILAGLEKPDGGWIKSKDTTWSDIDKNIHVAARKRKVGMVFQDYALFPNMTVEQQLKYAQPSSVDKEIISLLLKVMELEDLRARRPNELSGGQKQRTALARAIASKPNLLLLDEPLAAIDSELRQQLQLQLLQLQESFGFTIIMVSHDITEIMRISDQVMVLKEGKMTQYGKPEEVFDQPKRSGKFTVTGDVVNIEHQGFLYIVSVKVGKDIIKVVADESEGLHFSRGDKVNVTSKAFNPIITKINP